MGFSNSVLANASNKGANLGRIRRIAFAKARFLAKMLNRRSILPGPLILQSSPPGNLSFPDDLDQHALGPVAVELAVEDLLPRPEIQLAFGDGDDDFPTHDLTLQVSVGVVLAGAVVVIVVGVGVEGSDLFEPFAKVVVQAFFVVIDKNGSGDVHRVAKDDPLGDAAALNYLFNLGSDIQESHFGGQVQG